MLHQTNPMLTQTMWFIALPTGRLAA